MDRKKKIAAMGRGIFFMLAIGTLPVLFMNPLQYISALFLCGGIAFSLAYVLV